VRPDQFYKVTSPEFWTLNLEQEFARIAIERYPEEACAFIINGKLVPIENISNNPTEEFEVSSEDSLLSMNAQGFIHSHPDGPHYPSASDMLSQKSVAIPFGIMTSGSDSASHTLWMHDRNLEITLENRPFIHGISDCYSLIRAYYYQSRQIKLLDFPRDYNWWEGQKDKPALNLYLDNFEKAGFRPLKGDEEIQEGDVILMNIQTKVVSHAAVYLGNGLILHHLRDRISKKDHAASWKKFFHTVVRYE
jgi:cell wall-associated NlpC family hydrolase